MCVVCYVYMCVTGILPTLDHLKLLQVLVAYNVTQPQLNVFYEDILQSGVDLPKEKLSEKTNGSLKDPIGTEYQYATTGI